MKTSKFLLLVFTILVLCSSAFAQKHLIGIKGGVNLTNNTKTLPLLPGASCGLMYEYIFVKQFCAIEVGAMYNQRRNTLFLVVPADASGVYPDRGIGWLDGFSIPLQMNFYFGKKLYGNGFIGIEPSLLFRGRFFYYNGKEEVGKETLTIKKIDDFRYYFSGFAGFSIGYKIQNKYQPFTTIAYQRGFFPLQKNDEGLRGMNISVGLKYIMRN